MTSSLPRGRPRRARSHLSPRVAHAVLGGAAGVVWLVLPGMTAGNGTPVAAQGSRPAASAAVAPDEETSATDLVLPLVAVGAVGAVAGYGYLRRVRRARDRTTPGGIGTPSATPSAIPSAALSAAPPHPADLDAVACASLVRADDRVRAARAELGFAGELLGPEAVGPFGRALREAEGELTVAFRMRQRYDEGVPAEEAARRHTLAGIVGRCEEAGRRLDGPGRLGSPEPALPFAEARFRELAGRTGAAQALLADLTLRYAPTATSAVTGNVEQAKDRLLFATFRLNRARQAADSGEPEQAVRDLRAAQGAVGQAGVFLGGVDRLAAALRDAEGTVPAALTGAEAELAEPRAHPPKEGERHPRLLNADSVLASVRQELASGQPYDPLGVLRRIVRAVVPLASGRSGVLSAAALTVAREAVETADDFVGTHRGAVGVTARTRLAEARRLLTTGGPADRPAADARALEALELAELDVRAHGNPAPGAGETAGTGGAVLGGIVPADDPEHGHPPGFRQV
ncbi:hypothetical protein ACWD25_22530 [Streptomyces sp. NPDC002920]